MSAALNLPRQWFKPLIALILVTLCSVGLFFETWASIVSIWMRSETFAHGFLVLPISLWLVWTRKEHYRSLYPQFSLLGLGFISACGFMWLAADLANVLVIRQWAVVGMLVGGCWAVLGNRVAGQIMFPLLFLFLMVPFGEEFIPYLMEYTATFVVTMLRLTGISVYREGLFFTLSSGNWSVVEGCSGLRYLIASFTLGTVYAYLNYTSQKKRTIFMVAAFIVPIIANGFRAYMIVMIGHLSNMKLATGVDHIIYGWVFFGLVMLLLFYMGSFWQDPPLQSNEEEVSGTSVKPADYSAVWSVLAGTVLALSIWPWLANNLHDRQIVKASIPAELTPESIGQTTIAPDWGWEPNFKGVMADSQRFFNVGDSTVAMYLANFGDESAGGELVNSQNFLVPQKHPYWRNIHSDKLRIQWQKQEDRTVNEAVLSSDTRDLLVVRWFRIGQINTSNNYYAKWLQFLKRLSGDASPELMIVLYTNTPHGEYQQARETLSKIALACCD